MYSSSVIFDILHSGLARDSAVPLDVVAYTVRNKLVQASWGGFVVEHETQEGVGIMAVSTQGEKGEVTIAMRQQRVINT